MLFQKSSVIWPLLFIIAVFLCLPFNNEMLSVLKSIISTFSILAFFRKINKNSDFSTYSLLLIAIIFNPLVPLFFTKSTWVILNLISGIFFVSNYKPKSIKQESKTRPLFQ